MIVFARSRRAKLAAALSAAVLFVLPAASSHAQTDNASADQTTQSAQSGMVAEGSEVIPARLSNQSLLLDIIPVANGRLLTVGERGHVLVSDDQGDSWRQILNIPTRAALTKATAVGDQVWAAGHDTTIINSQDNGETWSIQFEDVGGDPLMDISFGTDGYGLAVGAYGLFMVSDDGGENWSQEIMADLVIRDEAIEDQESLADEDADFDDGGFLDQSDMADFEDLDVEYHLNSLLRLDEQRMVIAAEAGRGYYSEDNGENWRLFRLPYDGSMFGVIRSESNDCMVTFGLRGNIFQSCDGINGWQAVDSGVSAGIFDGAYDATGDLWLIGANGTLLRQPRGGALRAVSLDTGDDYNGLLFSGERLILIGESGVESMSLQTVE